MALAHLKEIGRFCLCLAGSLFILGFIFAWSAGLGFILMIFAAPVVLITYLLGGLVLVVRRINRARTEGASRLHRLIVALAAPAMLVALVPLALPTLRAGSLSGIALELLLYRTQYEAIVARARDNRRAGAAAAAFETHRGISYIVDRGPPVRVAFNPEGMLDNWSGIIFDPTGDVMLADGWDAKGRFRAPERVTRLFGGDLVACRPLWADFYTCSFT